MDRLGDMRLFVEAAALGSLSAAGRKLGLSPAAASSRLLKLEKSLTARLFERTTRPTQAHRRRPALFAALPDCAAGY